MKKMAFGQLLAQNTYPGRGIALGLSEDGKSAVMVYFIMGRSENSRNRVFTEKDGGIITETFDPSKMVDPSLIIYAPVRVMGGATIVTNGDQTDTVYEFMAKGRTFEDALRTRTFEPDAPNFTPRVSGLTETGDDRLCYRLSILKSADGNEHSVQRFFYDYPQPVAGEGHFIHTYLRDGNPIPSFEGDPERVALRGDIDALTKEVWEGLNEQNKVSLFVRYQSLATGRCETRIINRHTK